MEADARRAGLLRKNNWKKYPQDMYFARTIGRAARWHVPHLFGGAIYTPEELGAMIMDDGTVIIEGEVEDITERVTEPALNLKGSGAVVTEPTPSRVEGDVNWQEIRRQHNLGIQAQACDLHSQGKSVDEIAEITQAPTILIRSWIGVPL